MSKTNVHGAREHRGNISEHIPQLEIKYTLFSWEIDGETVSDFIFLGSKITTDVDCSHEIKRHLLLERKATTKLDSILKKQRHYFVYKGPSS